MSEAGPTADQGQAEELLLPGLPGSCGYLYADDISGEIDPKRVSEKMTDIEENQGELFRS